MHKTFDHIDPILALSLYQIDTIFDYYYFLAYPSIYTYKSGLSVGKPTGQHPFPITYSQKPKSDPKMGRDYEIFASSGAPSSIGCQSPKNDQVSPKTWSRANMPPTLTCDSSLTLVWRVLLQMPRAWHDLLRLAIVPQPPIPWTPGWLHHWSIPLDVV